MCPNGVISGKLNGVVSVITLPASPQLLLSATLPKWSPLLKVRERERERERVET